MEIREIKQCLRATYNSLKQTRDLQDLLQIIPVAYPVVFSTWKVKVVSNEPTGMVDRYILEIIRDFGPCDIEQIDEFLCLGQDVISNALTDMIRLGAPVRINNGKCSLNSQGDIQNYQVEQVHPFKFVINGITGDLLPTDFVRRTKDLVVSDDSDSSTNLLYLTPIVNGLESKRINELKRKKVTGVYNLGVPDGFVEFIDRSPISEECQKILCFLFVFSKHPPLVFAATEKLIQLTLPEGYIEKLPKFAKIIHATPVACPSMGDGLQLDRRSPNDTTISVSVSNQDLWKKRDVSDSFELKKQYLVRDFVRHGWFWDISNDYAYYPLSPGDENTSKILFVKRAGLELSRNYSGMSPDETSLWLTEYYKAEIDNYPFQKQCPSLNFFLRTTNDDSEDGEFKEFLSKVPRIENSEATKQGPAKICFVSSNDLRWEDTIWGALRSARQSLRIISPVIDDNKIFALLDELQKQGINVMIVTPLHDDTRKGTFKGDPQFSSYKLPRQKLAKLGASVRAPGFMPHAKMVIVDDNILLFLSANLNPNSLGNGKNNALEICTVFQNHPAILTARTLFDEIWQHCPYRQFIRGGNQISIVEESISDINEIQPIVRMGVLDFIFSTPENIALANHIASLIELSQKEIVLMAMSLYDLEQVPVIFDSLMNALKRDVRVIAILRNGDEQFKAGLWPDPSTSKLMEAGMKIHEIPHLHAKSIFVDGKHAVIMSANFNPYSLGDTPTSHIELGLCADLNQPFASELYRFCKNLIKKAH